MSERQLSEISRSELERRRTVALRNVDIDGLRERPALEDVAEAAAAVCDVPMAHISITDSDNERVVGQVGMSYDDYACGAGSGLGAMVGERVTIVEDVAEDESFDTEPFEQFCDEIRFYGGIPLLVDDTPVGSLVLLDSKPGELDYVRRAALFGLVHEVESHLRIHRELGDEGEPGEQLSARLTSMVAHATRLRWHEEATPPILDVLDDLEKEIERAREALDEMVGTMVDAPCVPTGSGGFLATASTPAGTEGLDYEDTEVEDR